mgnify:CR=1 FL=1
MIAKKDAINKWNPLHKYSFESSEVLNIELLRRLLKA